MANEYDMSWDEVGTASTGFLTLENGRQGNRIRIVSKPSKVITHWERGVDGRQHKIICPGAACPVCKKGEKPSVRYAMLVLDKKNWTEQDGYGDDGPKVKLMETGITVVRAIKDYATSSLYGDPSKYDLIIKKEGSGRDTKYAVVPDPNKSDLTAEELEAVKNAQTVRDLNKENTVEEIMAMGLVCLSDTPADLGEGGAPTAPASGSNADSADGDWNMF